MKAQQFNALHHQKTPLIICNVWDVASAKTAEKLNFKAIGTSSAAIASMLGYEDGEEISFEELHFIVKRITSSCSLPLTVDIEAGYSTNPLTTAAYIKALVNAGVVGINIEDSVVNETRSLVNANIFADYLTVIKEQLAKEKIDIYINVRTDTFLLAVENTLAETQKRVKLYEKAGADGLFVPCITNKTDIEAIVAMTTTPINVMCMPDLPDFKLLSTLGVKRISMGNFLFDQIQNSFEEKLNTIRQANSFQAIF
jgi:2-methylisocitrate lyase-like PEP mutase family enzyme